jgi:hypothetical protein
VVPFYSGANIAGHSNQIITIQGATVTKKNPRIDSQLVGRFWSPNFTSIITQ